MLITVIINISISIANTQDKQHTAQCYAQYMGQK